MSFKGIRPGEKFLTNPGNHLTSQFALLKLGENVKKADGTEANAVQIYGGVLILIEEEQEVMRLIDGVLW